MKHVRVIVLLTAVLAFSRAELVAKPLVRLGAGSINTETAHRSAISGDGKGYYIVQFSGPVVERYKAEAQECGVELLDYLPDFAFIARADADSLKKLAAKEFVSWVGYFRPEYKLSSKLPKSPSARLKVNILTFPGESLSEAQGAVAVSGGRVEAASGGKRGHIRAEIPSRAVESLSRVPGIAWIEPYFEPRLTNAASRTINGVASVWQDLGFRGNGQVVAVADTGLDNGHNDSTMSADFRGRILKAYALGRKNDWSDREGHGTHVCGSVLGNGTLSGANATLHDYGGSFAGMAPEARLIIQSVADRAGNLSGLPANLVDLFSPIYTDGARIHTNSWGAAYLGAYPAMSQQVDQFLWDHKDMTILFSAGNSGVDANGNGVVDLDSLDAPATAKNCITVGASESSITTNSFTYGAAWPSDYPSNPIKSDLVANNPSGMAAFSSRGPTDDGRIKPDICAPGTNIVSARSHLSGTGTLWGVYNSNYLYSGGTSMSTPITAGCVALVREFLVDVRRIPSPSGALVKAALLNSAADLNPGQYGTGAAREIPSSRPNNIEGWGRVSLRDAVQPLWPSNVDFIDASGLGTGASGEYTYEVQNTSVPLKITLAWTDYPGAVQAAKELVNDLDLLVIAPGGQQYRGNSAVDRLNNVETVDIPVPSLGTYMVRVTAYNVPQGGSQPYAIALMGGFGEVPSLVQSVRSAKSQMDGTLVALPSRLVTAGTEILGDHFYVEDLDRSSGIRVSYTGGVVTTGSMAYVIGRLSTTGGERTIEADSAAVLSIGNPPLQPFGVRGVDAGGSGQGATTIGLLSKVWGQVKSWGTDSFVIDDGSGPITVRSGLLDKPAVDSFVAVTGVSSLSSGAPLIKARFQSDIQVLLL